MSLAQRLTVAGVMAAVCLGLNGCSLLSSDTSGTEGARDVFSQVAKAMSDGDCPTAKKLTSGALHDLIDTADCKLNREKTPVTLQEGSLAVNEKGDAAYIKASTQALRKRSGQESSDKVTIILHATKADGTWKVDSMNMDVIELAKVVRGSF